MTDFGAPPPPRPRYPEFTPPYQQPPPPPPAPPSAPAAWGSPPPPPSAGGRFGERLARRPEPRFGTALAGAGAGLTLLGILVWGGNYFSHADSLSTNRNLLGAALAAVVAVLGYLLAIATRRGPLATAGVVAGGIGVPLALGFATLDVTNLSDGLPLNFDVIFWVSVVFWVASYVAVPGMRGHTFFVFLIAYGFLIYVVLKSDSSPTTPLQILGSAGGITPRFAGTGAVAAVGLIFGMGYYLIAVVLDRTGRHGPATGLLYPAFNATVTGVIAWSPDLHLVGAGIITIVIGLFVSWYGGRFGRRVTCFLGAGGVALGIGLLVAKAAQNDATAAGVTFTIVGVIVVAVAAALAAALREPDDMDPDAVVRSR
ncbi:MAG TPA: hypothetical protein VKB75_18410 [Jatrophihabitans sp.]|nr:hypothetical protein [Jatrophihabitans sp.]